jgi:hypothetical protein
MFDRIRNYFERRRFKKVAEKVFKDLQTTTTASASNIGNYTFVDTNAANTLTWTNGDGEKIFSIEPCGEAIWHKEDTYNEAAAIFLHHVSMQIENAVGIARNRQDWEQRIREALIREAEKEPLTADVLTDVLNKCIMYDKLKGIDSGIE